MSDDRTYPKRPIIGVGGVIWKESQVLLVRESKPPRDKVWGLPGGAVEVGETLHQALHREIAEETGLEIEVGALIRPVEFIDHDEAGKVRQHFVVMDYTCTWVSGEPRPMDGLLEVRWADVEELDNLDMWHRTRKVIRQSSKMAKVPTAV